MFTDLVDRIYESAFRPEAWQGVLGELSEIAGGQGAMLFAARKRVLNWIASETLHDLVESYVVEGWPFRCTRKARWSGRKELGFVVEEDIWRAEELNETPIYRDFLRPRGLGWSAGTAIGMPTGDDLMISVERAHDDGPVESERISRLNAILPHLARGAFTAARLQLKTARDASQALAALGLPAFVVDRVGTVKAINTHCVNLQDFIHWRAQDRFVFKDGTAQFQLERGLAALDANVAPPTLSFPMRDPYGEASKIVHIVPIRRSARDLFVDGAVMIVVTPVARPEAPQSDLVRSLFDLTPSESRLALAIAGGRGGQDVVVAIDGTSTAIQTDLRGVLDKTGCRRQADLATLLASLTLSREPSC